MFGVFAAGHTVRAADEQVVDDAACGCARVMLLLPLVMMVVYRWVQQMRRYFDTKRDPKAKVKEPETRCSLPQVQLKQQHWHAAAAIANVDNDVVDDDDAAVSGGDG
jgi:hypothetical protein